MASAGYRERYVDESDKAPIRAAFQAAMDDIAREHEHSHVDSETRDRIHEIGDANPTIVLADEFGRLLAEQLSPDQAAQIIADWLEVQAGI